jgi:phosphoenolpyruvate synthase/pyruvate phosphate dikinase
MNTYALSFREIDKTKVMMVGGKGANLGELAKISGMLVPDGFCITTEAYKKTIAGNPTLTVLLKELTHLKAEERSAISAIGASIRTFIESIPIPGEIEEEIVHHLAKLDEKNAYAIRSSATAEDLPMASFAGQQDTYLNVTGTKTILRHINKCWASLFTDRAIIYRVQNGFDHSKVYLSVVVQKMVFPQVAGILFTADPVTGNRKVVSIDASFGLGEAMVSGLVNADNYKVVDGKITGKKISTKKRAIYPLQNDGTKKVEIEPAKQNMPALNDEQVLELAIIGRKIETHFGQPQDIEWCLADDRFYIVQSRPITTLFPVPEIDDKENHVYVSVGHQQMMTDVMKPLGLSVRQLTTGRSMYNAGGRMFVDITPELSSPVKRRTIVEFLGKSDPLIRDALTTIIDRGDFIQLVPDEKAEPVPGTNREAPPTINYEALHDYDPAVVSELIQRSETSIEELKQMIHSKSGLDLLDFIVTDIDELRRTLFEPRSFGVIMTGMNASVWINEKIFEWLGEKNVADTISQSVSNNITSEMGLELMDVADIIRPYPEIVEYMQQVKEDDFPDKLLQFKGGREVHDAILSYLDRYGMRCAGEIDITRTRWREKPVVLVPMILNNIRNFGTGAAKRKFEQGRQEAMQKEQELLNKLKQLPDGEQKAGETKRMIDLVRNLIGYREYPKYAIVSRYFIYKQALLKEAERLVRANVIEETEDIYYLSFEELREVVRTSKIDQQLIRKRREEYRAYEKLSPPRVITSDGEILSGKYKRGNLPADAIIGLPVSSGVVEGRARVILNMEDASLGDDDILVTSFTDPSWTPLFVSIKGLVTEVGGLMTHGSVIAREYGLPAVVGIDNATKLIKDGQRIRVNGTDGFIEIL